MSSLRKSTRATAGHLPSRYKDDIIPDDVLQTLGAENSVVEMQSSLLRTPSQGGQVRSGGRPRGRPRTKHLHQRPADNVGIAVMANDDVCYETRVLQKYPDAAFPTLDFPTAIAVRGNANIAPVAKRDSMDIRVSKSPTGISSQAANQGQILPKVEKFVLDGRYIDAAGNTLHGLAAYYDAHFHQYENEHHDSQGDSREKNAAFKLFLETPEAEQAMLPGAGGNGLVTEAFDRWWKKHGMKSVLKSSAEDMNHIKAFKDEGFATLHFKLQWAIIVEIEDDLARYPPRNAPFETGIKSYRYARDILGIGNALVVRSIWQQMEEAMNDQVLMPTSEHYFAAATYLQDRNLPLTLIEMYNYLAT